ncbi:spindle assembly abnormal protein 6 homolog [Palaemon carinicauda]|uniref:spindle assembly abnormal protein 6 homolog n=1 Tax=Palaemon carinicauda TaxID=392227 RepID=UPI0035B59930
MESFKVNINNKVLFDGEVVVRVLENGSSLSSASARSLKLLVQLGDKAATSKELLVRLTDEQDPFMLYTCVVCEEDYQSLRQHQGLLIDFAAFPHKFVELVNTCIRENETSSPRFVLVLRPGGDCGGSSTLEVVEVNIFKHLCHLALTLAPASTQLKLTYLAECCKGFKAEIVSKEREANENELQLKQQIRHLQDLVTKSSSEAQHWRTKLEQQTALSSEKHAKLLNHEKDKLLKLQSDADRKADRERRDLEARMNHRIEQLQTKVNSLSAQNNEISERKHRAENTVRELRTRLTGVEAELERCQQELLHTKKHNAHLDQDYQSKCKLSRDLETRVAHLEAELLSKETSLTHTQQLLEALQQQKQTLEESLEERKQKVAKRENSIQLIYAELQKSLDIIKKLQKRLRDEHMRNKVQEAALIEQEKVVGEKDSKLSALNEQLNEITTKFSKLRDDNEKLHKEHSESVEKIQEQDKILKTNENVIAWLNKQLNEAEISGAVIKRAPLTEAYLTSHNVPSHGFVGLPHGIVSHSTPMSSNSQSYPVVSSGWSGGTHSTLSSVRQIGNIPPIPEEISPRPSDISPPLKDLSPPDKENVGGLDPKYLEPAKSAAIHVHGLLRADYNRAKHPESSGKLGLVDNKASGKTDQKEKIKPHGKPATKGTAIAKKQPLGIKKPSSYFPRT